MKRAIVTMVLGEAYQKAFNAYPKDLCQEYARRHGLDLIVIDQPLDTSERGLGRPLAWQKCLLFEHAEVLRYDQVLWLDSDILINPSSPNIFESVPLAEIGAVEAFHQRRKKLFTQAILEKTRPFAVPEAQGLIISPHELPDIGRTFHTEFDLPATHETVVQTGVMVLSPIHRQTMLKIYDGYEDKGHSKWNYEMRPMSHEFQEAHRIHWLHPKFNMIWVEERDESFVSLAPNFQSNVLAAFGENRERIRGLMVHLLITECLTKNYFLHFAGMKLLDMNYASEASVME